jgi:hypothetical protein
VRVRVWKLERELEEEEAEEEGGERSLFMERGKESGYQ